MIYVCDHPGCIKEFGRRDYLERHRANHLRRRPHVCSVCGNSYARADVLKRHTLNHGPLLSPAPSGASRHSPSPYSLQGTSENESGKNHQSQEQQTHSFSLLGQGQQQTQESIQERENTQQQATQDITQHMSLVGGSIPVVQPTAATDGGGVDKGLGSDNCLTNIAIGSPNQLQIDPLAGGRAVLNDWDSMEQNDDDLAPNFPPMPFQDPSTMTTQSWTVQDLLPWLLDATEGQTGNTPSRNQVLDIAAGSSATDIYREQSFSYIDNVEFKGIPASSWRDIMTLTQDLGLSLSLDTFSCLDVNTYIDLYYLHFDPLYPIIHRPTLVTRQNIPHLLLSMVCIGAIYSAEDSAYATALAIHDKLRRRMYEFIEDEPRLSVNLLQALLLTTYFGRMHGTLRQHDITQIYQSTIITLTRFSGIFKPDQDASLLYNPRFQAQWQSWVEAEESIRLAWFVFISDVSNSAMFNQNLALQFAVMDIKLPSTEASWRASSSDVWVNMPVSECYQFMPALRHLLIHGAVPNYTDTMGHWILLHGVLYLTSILRGCALGGLLFLNDSTTNTWHETLFRSLAYFHQLAISELRLPSSTLECIETSQSREAVALSSMGISLLRTDLEAIRIFAAASQVAGRKIRSTTERAAAQAQLTVWAQTGEAAQSAWYALQLMQIVLQTSSDVRVKIIPTGTVWCGYIAALVIWAYTTLLEGKNYVNSASTSPPTPYGDTPIKIEPYLALVASRVYCDRLLSCGKAENLIGVKNKSDCVSIVAYMAHLCGEVPWGVIQGSKSVLLRLLQTMDTSNARFVRESATT